MPIVVNTPNGKVGRLLASRLLDAGEIPRLITRDPRSVETLAARGAEIVVGSMDDCRVLDDAFADASAVFWCNPRPERPDFFEWSSRTAQMAAETAATNGVTHAAVLSCIGAHHGHGNGPVGALLGVETAFRDALANVVVLRSGFFFENVLADLDTIVRTCTIFSPMPLEKPLPWVAARDIAQLAVQRLTHPGEWTGHEIMGVHGPMDLSIRDIARLVGDGANLPIRACRVTLDQAKTALRHAGMPEFAIALYLEMHRAIDCGRLDPAETRTPESTTPTAFAVWVAEVLKPALEVAAVQYAARKA